MSKHLILLTAAALAACSAGMQPSSSEASLNEGPIPPAIAANLIASSPAEAAPAEPAPLAPASSAPVPEQKLAGAKRTASPSCNIIVQPTSHGIRLKAIARSADRLSGHYSMVVTKRGRAGSSDITQGGPFKLNGGEVSLSSAELSVEDAAHYQAVLTIHVGDRQVCRREVRS